MLMAQCPLDRGPLEQKYSSLPGMDTIAQTSIYSSSD